jgi:hypothetical protein
MCGRPATATLLIGSLAAQSVSLLDAARGDHLRLPPRGGVAAPADHLFSKASMVTLHDALEYRDLGLAVIPAIGKRPAVSWKDFQRTAPTESHLRRWFGDDDQPAIAVLNGEPSGGLVCRDFDDMHAYDRWAKKYPEHARQLPTAATPRPGRHVYCQADMQQVRSVAGSAIIHLGDGELRGGGITLLPPSVIKPGAQYRWLTPPSGSIPAIDLAAAGLMPPVQHRGHRERRRTQRTQGHSGTAALNDSPVSETIQYAIAATLPVRAGERHRRLFDLARELKAIPALASADLARLKPIVRSWHQAALPIIGTKPFDETWLDFAEAWDKVKFPKGQGPMCMIFSRARDADPPPVAAEYETSGVKLLIRLCRELQRYHGTNPFHLDCRTAAELLGVEHTAAWRWLKLLQHDRVIRLESTGSRASRRANCYRYLHEL